MSRTKRRTFAVRASAASVAIGLLLAACGSSETTSTPTQPQQPAAPETPAEAEEPEFEFTGNIIYVNTRPPGGSADLLARLIAEALPRHLPGNPRVIVENIGEGGGAVAMHNVTSIRNPEDIVMVHVTGGVMLRWVLGAEGHDYPLDTMLMVGGLPLALVTAVAPDIADINALAGGSGPVLFGSASAGSTGGLLNFLVGELFEMDYRQVFGLSGEAGVILALEQGELSGASIVDSLYLSSVEGLGWATGLMQTGLASPDGLAGFARSPSLPNIPTYAEAYQQAFGRLPTGPAWEALAAVAGVSSSQQAVMMPAGTPPQALEALQRGFEAMMADESWVALTRAATGAPVEGLAAAGASAALARLTGLDEATVELLRGN